jgi:hypothetical protein
MINGIAFVVAARIQGRRARQQFCTGLHGFHGDPIIVGGQGFPFSRQPGGHAPGSEPMGFNHPA